MSENSRSFVKNSTFKNGRLGHWYLQHRCYIGVLGLSFSTHSRILFSSECLHYKIFIYDKMLRKLKWQILSALFNWCQGPVRGRGPAVEKNCFKGQSAICVCYFWCTVDTAFCTYQTDKQSKVQINSSGEVYSLGRKFTINISHKKGFCNMYSLTHTDSNSVPIPLITP
jgi:hypothetical protein